MAQGSDNSSEPDLSEQLTEFNIRQLLNGDWKNRPDSVVCEEPLEIQVQGRPLSLLMRTPGHDEDLVAGFLMSEEIVSQWEDIDSVRHCTEAADPAAVDNVIQVRLRSGVELDFTQFSRHFFGSSSCGVCGKATLEQAMKRYPPIDDPIEVKAAQFTGMMERFGQTQDVFRLTGGLHAAALFNADGNHLITREDIGRHNAVDKVIGWAYREGYNSLKATVLVVSGRVSFEIGQKSLAAGIPIIAAISAPSSLAIQLAIEANQTLVGFVRGTSLNIYSSPDRICMD